MDNRKNELVSSLRSTAVLVTNQFQCERLIQAGRSVADISKTSNCALAKAVRKRLRGLGVNTGIPVVFSTEMANPDAVIEVEGETCKRTTTGTISYMPAIFGCYLAAYAIRQLCQ